MRKSNLRNCVVELNCTMYSIHAYAISTVLQCSVIFSKKVFFCTLYWHHCSLCICNLSVCFLSSNYGIAFSTVHALGISIYSVPAKLFSPVHRWAEEQLTVPAECAKPGITRHQKSSCGKYNFVRKASRKCPAIKIKNPVIVPAECTESGITGTKNPPREISCYK